MIRLRTDVPTDRQAAILALLRAREANCQHHAARLPDLITGPPMADPGGNLALQLCLETTDDATSSLRSEEDIDRWAEQFLHECGETAEADMVLANVATGSMRLVEDSDGNFSAWIAAKRAPAIWQERADLAWWASWLTRHAAAPTQTPDEQRHDAFFRGRAETHIQRMAYQIGYPADAVIGGCSIQTSRDLLRLLIAWALREQESGASWGSWPEDDLIVELAGRLALDPAIVRDAIGVFTLDRENAAWHAAVPGVAAAPLVRTGPDRLAWSLYGLMTEPFFFLTRELRRRDQQAYNTSAQLREDVFRQDLYALFADKRFVTGPRPIALRRAGGDLGADIDAVVFDRKTGALGLFELKSHDPFARTPAELARQQENLLYANRQVSGVLTWINRHGPDAILSRVDPAAAKRFRVHKVYPFILSRYLAHVGDGPEPDRRAAWGTWPQTLRLLDRQPLAAANPLASLHARLRNDTPIIQAPTEVSPRVLELGGTRLTIFSSHAASRANAAGRGSR